MKNLADDIAIILTRAFEADPECIEQLLALHAVGHSPELRDHPFITVHAWQDKADAAKFTIGILGVLNGLCTGDKVVAAVYSEGGHLQGFKTVSRKVKEGTR